jgi:DNA-binding HxlR family transcriptional regulator
MPDYSVGNAPSGASYAAPLVGFQFGKALSDLPEQYMQGREQFRKTQMEDMFRDPANLPMKDGQLDVNAIIARGAQIGGLPFVQGMIPFLNDLAISKQVGSYLGGTDRRAGDGVTYAPPSRPSNVPNAAGASNLQPQPQDTSGSQGPLINQVIAETLGSRGPEFSSASIQSLARQLNIDPRSPLNPRQVQQVQRALSRSALPAGPEIGNQETNQPNVENSAAEVNGNAARPLPASGVSGAAGPSQGGFAERFAGGEPQRGLAPGISVQEAQRLEDTGNNQLKASVAAGQMSKPTLANNLKALGESNIARAKQMREQLGEAYKFTPEQKKDRDPVVQARELQRQVQEGDIKVSEKTYPGLQMLGQTGKMGNDKIDRMRVQMSDPNFFSGAGSQIVERFKQWSVSLGGNPNAANSIEELHKTVSQMLTDDIKAMGASGAGPVRVAEVQNMQKGIASLKQSPATVRYLLEELYRTHNDNMEIARLAQQYKSNPRGPGYLDANWDKIRDQYYQQNPLFSKEELADPRLVAPPFLPRAIAADPVRAKAWEKQQGLKSGDPIRTEDGKIRWVR